MWVLSHLPQTAQSILVIPQSKQTIGGTEKDKTGTIFNISGHQELAKYYIFVLDSFDFWISAALSLFLGYCERKPGRISVLKFQCHITVGLFETNCYISVHSLTSTLGKWAQFQGDNPVPRLNVLFCGCCCLDPILDERTMSQHCHFPVHPSLPLSHRHARGCWISSWNTLDKNSFNSAAACAFPVFGDPVIWFNWNIVSRSCL